MILGELISIEKGISHEEAGAILAEEILTDCGYTREERKFMTDTILRHRDMKEESVKFCINSFIVQINFKRLHPLQSKTGMLLAGRKEKQQVYILGEML